MSCEALFFAQQSSKGKENMARANAISYYADHTKEHNLLLPPSTLNDGTSKKPAFRKHLLLSATELS